MHFRKSTEGNNDADSPSFPSLASVQNLWTPTPNELSDGDTSRADCRTQRLSPVRSSVFGDTLCILKNLRSNLSRLAVRPGLAVALLIETLCEALRSLLPLR